MFLGLCSLALGGGWLLQSSFIGSKRQAFQPSWASRWMLLTTLIFCLLRVSPACILCSSPFHASCPSLALMQYQCLILHSTASFPSQCSAKFTPSPLTEERGSLRTDLMLHKGFEGNIILMSLCFNIIFKTYRFFFYHSLSWVKSVYQLSGSSNSQEAGGKGVFLDGFKCA